MLKHLPSKGGQALPQAGVQHDKSREFWLNPPAAGTHAKGE